MRIRMLIHISGGRHDDRPWPPANEEIDVPDFEGRDLVRAGHAVYVGPSEPPPAPLPAQPVISQPSQTAAGPALVISDGQDGETATATGPAGPVISGSDLPEGSLEDPPEPIRPLPSAPKQAWIDYAVGQGAEEDTAARMTKADLMSRYGGRL